MANLLPNTFFYKKYYLFVLYFIFINPIFGQNMDVNNVQYGFSLKTTIDLNGWENSFKYSNFNVSAIGGLAFHPFEASFLYPSLHAGLLIYNRGDLGSSYAHCFFGSTQFELITNITLHGGDYNANTNHHKRAVPLYHFSAITPNPLLNPFQHSISFGTNIIYSFDEYKEGFQRVGFLNVLVDRHLQFNMFNDGSFFSKMWLGDGHDRYYTGGGQFSYHFDEDYLFDDVELSFLKYTGYDHLAFETANLLQLDFIEFKNKESVFYNKNQMRLKLTSNTNNFSVHLTAHNTDADFQDLIHFNGDYSYFTDIFDNEKGLWNEVRRAGIGASYNYIDTTC